MEGGRPKDKEGVALLVLVMPLGVALAFAILLIRSFFP